MSLNWNFWRDGGFKPKNTLRGGSMEIFWNNTFDRCAEGHYLDSCLGFQFFSLLHHTRDMLSIILHCL